MKSSLISALLFVCVSTAPILLLLVVFDYSFMYFINSSINASSIGFMIAPFILPFVLAGTIISCLRSVKIKMRPLYIILGCLGVIMTSLITAYWAFILTSGFME